MYKKKAHIHFIGIGGIGMSAIATILKHQGYIISGCDVDLHQQSIINLKNIGCSIFEGNNTKSCADTTINVVVYSSAIQANNQEIVNAQKKGIATIPRALMLAELMRTKYSIAIAGSHGKTTTTSLISHILIEARIDPTVIIGGHLKTLSTNARFGLSDFLVAEADESDRSLLSLHPTLAVVTNIDLEHLETYHDLSDIKQTFQQFLSSLPFYGKAFVCADDENLSSLLPISHITTVKYGFNTSNDIFATDIQLNKKYSLFTAHQNMHNIKKKLGTIHLNMPGKHNILNALGAIALALDLDISFPTIATALANFQGVDQRFTYRGTFKGAQLFDDYGHHPKEIELTCEIARNCTNKKICVVFQPHRYTRTYHLWHYFIQVFLKSAIDHFIITDIFPASEQPIDSVTSERFAQELSACNPPFTVTYIPYESTMHSIETHINTIADQYDLILFLGAGKINRISQKLLS